MDSTDKIDMKIGDKLVLGHNLNILASHINFIAKSKGFWETDRNVGEMLMLVVSELAEGLEAHRKDLKDDHLPERDGLEVELADAVIRILDTAYGLGYDIGGAVMDKLEYNQSRPYKHGKKY